jgi:hypothetical protein
MRSVAQATPIGSILVWRTRQEVPAYERLGPYALKRGERREFASYILDGHQRLATLFGALKAPQQLDAPVTDDRCWEILYDLESEDFLLASQVEPGRVYVSLRVLLDSVESLRFQRQLAGRPDAETLLRRFETLAAAFQRYKIAVIPIVTDDLDQVTLTFQRVNSQGTVMGQLHMIHALTWSEDFDLITRLDELRKEKLAPLGWEEIDDQLVLTACKGALGLDLFEGEVDAVSRKLREKPDVLNAAVEHLVEGIRFLSDHCGITSPRLLPYGQLLPLLAEGLRLADDREETQDAAFTYWFWWTVYVAFAGGSNASRMRRAAENVRRVAAKELAPEKLMPPVSELAPSPRRFDFRHARAKALTLRMAERRDQLEGSKRILRDLNLRGTEMVQPLVLRKDARRWKESLGDRLEALLQGPANRVVAAAEEVPSLRRIIDDSMNQVPHLFGEKEYNAGLDACLIPPCRPESMQELETFLERRQELLNELERDFATSLGILTGAEAG